MAVKALKPIAFIPVLPLFLGLSFLACSFLREPERGELLFSLSFDQDTFKDTQRLLIWLYNSLTGEIEAGVEMDGIKPGVLPQTFPSGQNRFLKIEAFGPSESEENGAFLSRWGVGFSPLIDLRPGQRTELPDPICVYRTLLRPAVTLTSEEEIQLTGFLEPNSPVFLESDGLKALTFSQDLLFDPTCKPFTNYALTISVPEDISLFSLFTRNVFGAASSETIFFVGVSQPLPKIASVQAFFEKRSDQRRHQEERQEIFVNLAIGENDF